MPDFEVIIIGAGLAGLACARELVEQGFSPLILEATDGAGGRIRTDEYQGFLLDRGFQVLQTAYPEAQRALDYNALDLRPFRPGALIRFDGRFHTIGDPWRRISDLLPTLLSPIGTLADKLRMIKLRHQVTRGSWEALYDRPETTAMEALQAAGFTDTMIERFLRPFLAGVFFDEQLEVSSRAFEFVFRTFATGDTALPARGMEAIPRQLAACLPEEALHYNIPAERLEERTVVLASGEHIHAKAVVIATDAWEAARLLGDDSPPGSRSTTCLYFAASEPPVLEPLLVLNGDGKGPVNSLLIPSVLSPAYAPSGQHLITVNVLGNPPESDKAMDSTVRAQLKEWFGTMVSSWELLRTYRLVQALPLQLPPVVNPTQCQLSIAPWLFVCGEYRCATSIQWALFTGRQAGIQVTKALKS